MTSPALERLEFTKQLALEAAQLAQQLRRDKSADFIQSKGLQDFVTFADREVEALIRSRIAKYYPDDAFLGEEDGLTGDSDSIWVVDPIDGTTNFMHGLPEWAVSIAWCCHGVIELGVLAVPDSDILAWAEKGKGAYLNGQQMFVSDCAQVEQSVLMLGRSARTPLEDYLAIVQRLVAGDSEYRRNGAAAVSLLNVACGQAEAYYEAHLNAWDALAGLLLISEAGGRYEADSLEQFFAQGSSIFADNGKMTETLRSFVESEIAP